MIKSVLEVYVTDEASFIPYTSPHNTNHLQADPEDDGFYLHQGKVIETITYPILIDCSYGKDYKDISGSGNIKIPYRNIDFKYIYQGVRCKIITKINDKVIEYLGFVTKVKYSNKSIDVEISSYEKLLDVEGQCTYTQKLRSFILEEIIKEAGMVPRVDVKGLNDEVITYTSQKKSNDKLGSAITGNDCTLTCDLCVAKQRTHGHCGVGEDWDVPAQTGIANKEAAYYSWARKFKSDADMLRGLRRIFKYSGYYDNRDNCASQTFKEGGFSCNCGDAARLVKACCDSRGTPCVCIHGRPYGEGHYWNVIKLNSKWETFDLTLTVTGRGEKDGTNSSNIYIN